MGLSRNEGKVVGNEHRYFFHCVTCDEEGGLVLRADESGTFECPAGCGTVYVEYQANGRWLLRAGVVPHYED